MIRRAALEDAQGIARVHVRAWQSAYADVLPADALAALSVDERASMWQEAIRASRMVFVVEEGGGVEGFAVGGAARGGGVEGLGELYAIYVEPARWGAGFGRELLGAVETALRDNGFSEAILWVLEQNPRARRFYEASGWRVDASRRIEVLGVDVREVRYWRRL